MSDMASTAARELIADLEDVGEVEDFIAGAADAAASSEAADSRGRGRGRGRGGGRAGRGQSNAGAGGSRASKRVGKGYKVCEGCQQVKPETSFSMNQRFDEDCKKYLDNIHKQARSAGDQALQKLAEIRSTPKKLKVMLESYSKAYNTWVEKGKPGKGNGFCLVTYIEEAEATTGVEYVGEKVMMWERQAIMFWQSVDGGAISEEDAANRWQTMAAAKNDEKIPWDMLGPVKKPLRMAIPTRDVVNTLNSFLRKRKVEMRDKPSKSTSQENIDRMIKRTQMHHDTSVGVGGVAASSSLKDISHRMVTARAGEAFSHVGMDVDSMDAMLSEIVETPSGGKEVDNVEILEPDEEEPAPGRPSKGAWFDRDRGINTAVKKTHALLQQLHAAYTKKLKELEDLVFAVKQMSEFEQKSYAGELTIANVRITALKKLDGPPEELRSYIDTLKNASPKKSGPGVPSSPTASHAGLGAAPPCSLFAKLLTFPELEALVQSFFECETKAAVEDVRKTIVDAKLPISDLLSAAGGAASDIKKVIRSQEAFKKSKQGVSSSKPASSAPAPAVGIELLGDLMAKCEELPCLSLDKLKADTVEWGKPFLMHVPGETLEKIFNVPEMRQGMVDFVRDLGNQTSLARSESALPEAARKPLVDFCGEHFPETVRIAYGGESTDGDVEVLKAILGPRLYAIKKKELTFAHEKFCLPCFRLNSEGTRTIALTSFKSLSDYLSFASGSVVKIADGVATRHRCANFLKNVRADGLEKYTQAGGILWAGTAGPGDLLYVPAGMFFAEKVTDAGTAAGIRAPLLVSCDTAGTKFMETYAKEFEEDKSPAAVTARGYVKALTPLQKEAKA